MKKWNEKVGHFCAHTAELDQENLLRMVRWHCPPGTGFEIRTLAVWGRSRRFPIILCARSGWGRNIFWNVSFKSPRLGNEPRTLAWKATVLTTTAGPPPIPPNAPGLPWISGQIVDKVLRLLMMDIGSTRTWKKFQAKLLPNFEINCPNCFPVARSLINIEFFSTFFKSYTLCF